MAAMVPFTREGFAYYEMGIRVRQCEILYRYQIGEGEPARPSPQVSSPTHAIANIGPLSVGPFRKPWIDDKSPAVMKLWGASYQLCLKEKSNRFRLSEEIAAFLAAVSVDDGEKKALDHLSNRALMSLSRVSSTVRLYAQYNSIGPEAAIWFEIGERMPAVNVAAGETRWDDEERLAELLAIVEVDRNDLLADPIEVPEGMNEILPEQCLWNRIGRCLDNARFHFNPCFVDVERRVVTIRGVSFGLASETQALFMLSLVNANGEWRTSSQIQAEHGDKFGKEPGSRVRKGLPEEVIALVESKRPLGFRIRQSG